jgi:hypothetical protein
MLGLVLDSVGLVGVFLGGAGVGNGIVGVDGVGRVEVEPPVVPPVLPIPPPVEGGVVGVCPGFCARAMAIEQQWHGFCARAVGGCDRRGKIRTRNSCLGMVRSMREPPVFACR